MIPGLDGPFYRTGDMGALWEGQLYLTGRIKEMIIIGGKNIFPSDIVLQPCGEGVALSPAGMTVFSVHHGGKERPVLCAECRPDADFPHLAAQINKIVSAAFGFSFRDVVFVRDGALPRTDNRKIRTLAAKDAYEAGRLPVLFRTCQPGTQVRNSPAPQKKIVLSAQASPEELQPVVRELFSALIPGTEFGLEDSFLELGVDSLEMIELICTLEEQFHVTLDLREVVAAPTVCGIAAYLSDLLNGRTGERTTDLRGECVLAEDIVPKADYACPPETCRHVFVTGTTGFLGAYLVQELIRQRPDVAVYCHGRGAIASGADGAHREQYAPLSVLGGKFSLSYRACSWRPQPAPLGIAPEDYEKLSRQVELVIHNGAVLNFILPYRQMKDTNVTGTAEALRFACDGRTKYFHYISSYSVYDNPSHFGRRVAEDDPLACPDGYFLGYSETKWVAEKLVGIARARGLRTTIYRPGDITGTPRDGVWKLEDLISRSIVGCIQMGGVPEIEVNLHLTPVDYVAAAIVCIAFQSGSGNCAFNLLNEHLMPMKHFYRLLRQLGYPVEHLPLPVWREKLESFRRMKMCCGCSPVSFPTGIPRGRGWQNALAPVRP